MENRFTFKDLVLLVVLLVLVVMVYLAMQQYDRQWTAIGLIQKKLDAQADDLRKIQDSIKKLAAANSAATQPSATQPAEAGSSSATRPSAASADPTGEFGGNDPFVRIRVAQAKPDYARGDWLVNAFGTSVRRLTPILSSDAYASEVQNYVLQTLVDRDPDTLEYRPLIAESWEMTDNTEAYLSYFDARLKEGLTEDQIKKDPKLPDAIVITFKLRHNATFSDGEPLTAADVKFTFDHIMNPKIAAPRWQAYFGRIKTCEAIDDYTIRFTFQEPYFEAFELAGGIPVLPKHFYSRFSPQEFNESVGLLMGSGAYRMEDPETWRPGDLIQLVRNERYWGALPAFDRVIFKVITDDVAHLTAFRNGDIDVFPTSPEKYVMLKKDKALNERASRFEYESPTGGYRYIAWNQRDKKGKPTIFADKRVRQAMAMLLDRKQMIKVIWLNYGVEATGPFNPLSKQYDQSVQPWPFDPKRARALLIAAGCTDKNNDGLLEKPDGSDFVVQLTYPSGSPISEKMVLFIKDSFAKGGVELDLKPLEFAVMVENIQQKDFEAITLGWTAGIETDIYQMFHSSQAKEDGDNSMSYSNPVLDDVIVRARRTMDEAKRMQLWQECHRIIHEDQPYTFLSFGKSLAFVDKRIQNVLITKTGMNARDEWFVPSTMQRWTK